MSSSGSKVPTKIEKRSSGKTVYSLQRTEFEIDDRYEPIKPIGKGAYGVVCSAHDKVTKEKVAIKKISNVFENLMDAKRTLREIQLLSALRNENVIDLKHIMKPAQPKEKFNDVYLVYELMDTDLYQIVRSGQPLSDDHFQYFLYQLLRGLKYIHSANVLHRDLKPSNLLLNANCDLKICDFGLARSSQEQIFMTEYVVTRWYRAPELLLSCEQYTAAIDIWSVGCILGEMIQRKPLFPGKDYINQIKLIIQMLGTPSDEDLSFLGSSKAKQYLKSQISQKIDFKKHFVDANPRALDLLSKMLKFDPRKRISVEEALNHPYLKALHDPEAEPSAPGPFVLGFDEVKLDEAQIRELVYQEIMLFNQEEL